MEPTTDLETVARLAAEAATRALETRLQAAEETLGKVQAGLDSAWFKAAAVPELQQLTQQLAANISEILAALAQAAGPEGNAARLAARLGAAEETLAALAAAPPAVPEALQSAVDDLRQKVATLALERNPR